MLTRTFSLSAAVALLGAPLFAQQAAAPSPLSLGYWNGPDWEQLEAQGESLGLSFAAGLTESDIRTVLADLPGLAANQAQQAIVWPGHTVVVATAAGTTAAQAWQIAAQLSERAEVTEAAPLLVARTGEPLYLTDEILVRWNADVPTAVREAWTQGLELTATLDYTVNPGDVFRVDSSDDVLARANELAESGLVEFALPDFTVNRVSYANTNDPFFQGQWHLENTGQGGAVVDQDIDVSAAWDITRGTSSVTIAVIDTGVELAHPDLVDNLVQGVDVLSDDNDPKAEDGSFFGIPWRESHSTAVCGVSGGRGDNGIGTSGVAPQCTVMPIRFLSELFGPTPSLQDEADAMNFACNNGAAILNNSWGPGSGSATLPASTKAAIDNCNQFGRNGLGAIVFFAAGNSNSDNSGNGYAAYPGVLGITAVNDQGVRSSYSSYGSTVDCSAPSDGGNNGIVTTDRLGNKGYDSGDYTDSFGGTSSASPTAAGVMGLILSVDPGFTRDEAIDILLTTTVKVDLAGGSYNASGHSDFYGSGQVNAEAAVNEAVSRAAAGPSNTIYLTGTTFATAGDTASYQFSNALAGANWIGLADTATPFGNEFAGHYFDVSGAYTQVASGTVDGAGNGSFSGVVPAGMAGAAMAIEVVLPSAAIYRDSNGILLRIQ